MRSMVQLALDTSGWIVTQLSIGLFAPIPPPPQMRMVSGAVYGKLMGSGTAVPSRGYVRPARTAQKHNQHTCNNKERKKNAQLFTAPGIFGSCVIVLKFFGSRMRASL